jgi:hypothetical protein
MITKLFKLDLKRKFVLAHFSLKCLKILLYKLDKKDNKIVFVKIIELLNVGKIY